MCFSTKRFRWLLCLIQPIRKSGSCLSPYEVAEIGVFNRRYQTLKQSFLSSPWRPTGSIPEGCLKHAALTASAFIPATGLIQRGHVFRPRSSRLLPPPGPRMRGTHQPIQSHHIHLVGAWTQSRVTSLFDKRKGVAPRNWSPNQAGVFRSHLALQQMTHKAGLVPDWSSGRRLAAVRNTRFMCQPLLWSVLKFV